MRPGLRQTSTESGSSRARRRRFHRALALTKQGSRECTTTRRQRDTHTPRTGRTRKRGARRPARSRAHAPAAVVHDTGHAAPPARTAGPRSGGGGGGGRRGVASVAPGLDAGSQRRGARANARAHDLGGQRRQTKGLQRGRRFIRAAAAAAAAPASLTRSKLAVRFFNTFFHKLAVRCFLVFQCPTLQHARAHAYPHTHRDTCAPPLARAHRVVAL